MGRIWTESAHSLGRKATLTLEFMYLTINLIFGTWWGTRVKQLGSAGRQKSSPASSLGLALSTCVGVLPLVPDAKPKPSAPRRFGIGIFYVLLYMLLKVAFDSEGWLVQIGNVVQLLYLFLIIVQVGGCRVPGMAVVLQWLMDQKRGARLPELDLHGLLGWPNPLCLPHVLPPAAHHQPEEQARGS